MATLVAETSRARPRLPDPGEVVGGRYQIEEPIGQGGYGQVFRARHLGTGQDVGLKVLIPQGGDETFTVKRFFLEARVTSGLRHANTIKVFDFGQEDSGLVYLAMELLFGVTLREELRVRRTEGRPFSQGEAIELGIAITRSLGEAHAAGLVHRDLKPDNIFLHCADEDDEATVKVLDFGIVKLGDGEHTLSSTTSVPGTPAYMSPEHALNQDVDGRADLYSLGVILYQMVTLDLPFRGQSDPQTLFMHAYHPVPDVLAAAKTPISQAFAETISIALAKRPEDRFRDARALRDALKAGDASVSRPSRRPAPAAHSSDGLQMATPHADSYLMPTLTRPARRWERWAMVAGVAGVLFSGGAVWLAAQRGGAPKVEAPVPTPAAAPQPLDAGLVEDAGPPVPVEVPAPKKKKPPRQDRKKRVHRPPPPAPPPSSDLLHMRLEDLVKPKK